MSQRRKTIVYPGQKVITSAGKIETVAMVMADAVYVYGLNGFLHKVTVVGDAWGGEHDQTQGLAA